MPVDLSDLQGALNPHMIAINADTLKDRNYVLLWVACDGAVSMNATFSKTMSQYLDDTTISQSRRTFRAALVIDR